MSLGTWETLGLVLQPGSCEPGNMGDIRSCAAARQLWGRVSLVTYHRSRNAQKGG